MSDKFHFFGKNYYNLAEDIEFFARSILSSSDNVGPLILNDGMLEL